MTRYVVTFDTPDFAVLQDEAPELLSSEGISTERYYPRLGIGIVDSDADELQTFSARCRDRNRPVTFTPELTYYAIEEPSQFTDTDQLTWGLQAIGIDRARDAGHTGAGVRVAVLDTGVNLDHPDFTSRGITAESFIEGEGPHDAHGHGTHCIGTACGPWETDAGPGYGVAPEAEIFAGKVLGDDGTGSDSSILAGIDWALQHDCQVISMSLGADVREVHPPYVAAGRRALELGSLIVAAAGNNAQRSAGNFGFVGAPANSPHIMAVAAVDSALRTAEFSARSLPHEGGEVDLAAPGVDIHSAWTGGERYRSISGTSMATPHVAGIAALTSGATGARGQELWDALIASTTALEGEPSEDVGAGLTVIPELAEPRAS